MKPEQVREGEEKVKKRGWFKKTQKLVVHGKYGQTIIPIQGGSDG